jgi:D-3-phosphoglycerate dehydrogenase
MKRIVLIADDVNHAALESLIAAGLGVDCKPGISEQELARCIHGYDALIVKSGGVVVGAAAIGAAKKLAIIGCCGGDVSHVDVAAATKYGIMVINTPEGEAAAIAEHVFGLLLSLARNLPAATALSSATYRPSLRGIQLFRKTCGLVGSGPATRAVLRRCSAFGMAALVRCTHSSDGTDTEARVARIKALGAEAVSISEIYARADFLVFLSPLAAVLDEEAISAMRAGVFLVRCVCA